MSGTSIPCIRTTLEHVMPLLHLQEQPVKGKQDRMQCATYSWLASCVQYAFNAYGHAQHAGYQINLLHNSLQCCLCADSPCLSMFMSAAIEEAVPCRAKEGVADRTAAQQPLQGQQGYSRYLSVITQSPICSRTHCGTFQAGL